MEGEFLDTPSKENDTPVIDLEFVSMNVGSETENQRNKQIIRSTAMKSFHRKQHLQRTQEDGTVSRDSYSKAKRGSRSSTGNALPGSSWRGSFDRSSSRQSPFANSPTSLLGAGRVDPFRIQPVDIGSRVDELLDHCKFGPALERLATPSNWEISDFHPTIATSVLWPGLRPSRSDGTGSKISSAWLAKCYENPLVMHSLLFGAAVHLDLMRSPQSSLNNPIRLFHKVQTMQLMNEELKNAEKTPLDGVILAVLCLGTNEVETMGNNMKEKIRSPFNPPLSSSQWLDVYGRVVHVPVHTTAMHSLVSRRGGLEKVQLDGLAEVLS
jgi:hypothetical protein